MKDEKGKIQTEVKENENENKGGGEKMKLRGEIFLTLKDKDGNVKDERHVNNLIVNGGYDLVSNLIGNVIPTTSKVNQVRIGQGTTAPTPGDTALQDPTGDFQTGVYAHPSTTSFTISASFGTAYQGNISESGLFNSDAPTPIMLARQVFTPIAKASSDTLEIVWQISLA